MMNLLFEPDILSGDESDLSDCLNFLAGIESERVFHGITAVLSTRPQESDLFKRVWLRCADVLCYAKVSEAAITAYIRSQMPAVGASVNAAVEAQDRDAAGLALSVLAHIIHREADTFYTPNLVRRRDWLVEHIKSAILYPVIQCLTSICQCPAAKDPTFNALDLLPRLTTVFYELIPEHNDLEMARQCFNFLEILVPLLPDEGWPGIEQYFTQLYTQVEIIPTLEMPEAFRVLIQQCHLSMIGAVFRVNPAWFVESALGVLYGVLRLWDQPVISVSGDFIAALTEIVSVLPPEPPGSAHAEAVYHIIAPVFNEGNVEVTAEACALMAYLVGCLPRLHFDDIAGILHVVCEALQSPSCLPRFYPKLLSGFSSIISAVRADIPVDLLTNCVIACQIAVSKWNLDDIEFSNILYQAIFEALGALMHAGNQDRGFLVQNEENWFRVVRELARDAVFHMTDETLSSDVSFIHLAFRCLAARLPSVFSPRLAQIHVRVPLGMGLAWKNQTIQDAALKVYNELIAEEGSPAQTDLLHSVPVLSRFSPTSNYFPDWPRGAEQHIRKKGQSIVYSSPSSRLCLRGQFLRSSRCRGTRCTIVVGPESHFRGEIASLAVRVCSGDYPLQDVIFDDRAPLDVRDHAPDHRVRFRVHVNSICRKALKNTGSHVDTRNTPHRSTNPIGPKARADPACLSAHASSGERPGQRHQHGEQARRTESPER
jgi:hypothetical protein